MIAGLPYDAEVEYLESTGTQWIDTGVSISDASLADVTWNVEVVSYNDGCMGAYGSGSYASMYFNMYANKFYMRNMRTSGGSFTGVSGFNTVRFSGGNSYLNGTAVETDIPLNTKPVPTMYLFAYNRNGTTTGFCKARVSSFTVKVGEVLIADFIPVRFTNELGQAEGAMYDRVSKKLFRNAGTGSFVVGPDVAVPVMGLHFMRRPRYTAARDYVQDGLVAMWDGIENAGWGVHDASATTWKDLVGNGYDLDIYGSVEPNCVRTTNTSAAGMSGTISGISTIECCCKISPSLSSAQALLAYSGPIDTTNLGLVQYGPSVGYQCFSNIFWDYPLIATEAARTVAATTATTATACYVDGVGLQPVSHSADQWNNQSYTGIGGRHWQNHTWRGAGDYYCVRFYNRVLTAAEIAHNYAVDKERFNLS